MDEEEIIQITMYVPEEHSTGTYDVVRVSDNQYKLTNNDPFNEILTYGTIIEVEPKKNDDGAFVFKEISVESDYSLQVIGLPMELSESELRIVGQMIVDDGGFWEVIFGGMGYVNLRNNSSLDVIDELNKLIRAKRDSGK